jgi:ABC-type ATPase with predicted acetyltransferase domain
VRTFEMSVRPSGRVLRACAGFGVGLTRRAGACAAHDEGAHHIARACVPGAIALITGPSGSGKSRLLSRVVRAARQRRVAVIRPPARRRADRALLDCLPGGLDGALRALAAAGLADAALLVRTPAELSEGEFWRFALASAMLRAKARAGGREAIIVCDEWCTTLDRRAARAVCITARRWMSRQRVAGLLCATAHDDVAAWLNADMVIDCGPDAGDPRCRQA